MKTHQYSIVIALCLLIICGLGSCKKDESLPALDDVVIGLIPADNETFVSVDSKIKVLLKSINHTHENDLGSYTFEYGIMVKSNTVQDSYYGATEFKKGNGVDTLIFTAEKEFSKQSKIDIDVELFWNSNEASSDNFVHYYASLYTIPFSLPLSAVKQVFPENNATDISTFCQPSVSFIYSIDKEFKLNGNTYKYVAKEIKFLYENSEENATLSWNSNNTEVLIVPESQLQNFTEYELEISTQLMVKENGTWLEVNETEKVINKFTTEAEQSKILLEDDDIEFSYPAARQYNFHKDEHPKGYLKTKTSYSWMNEEGTSYKIIFSDATSTYGPFIASYNTDNKWIEFNIQDFLENNTIYKLQLLRNNGNQEDTIYSMHFKTSLYSTFEEKMNSFEIVSPVIIDTDFNGVFELKAYHYGDEYFDNYEMAAQEYVFNESSFYRANGLVQIEADTNNLWYQNYLKHLYEAARKNQLEISYRNKNDLGLIPLHLNYYTNDSRLLTDEEIATNKVIGYIIEGYEASSLIYQLSHISYLDYDDMLSQVMNIPKDQMTAEKEYLTLHSHPGILSGGANINRDYHIKVKVKYVIPGINKVTTEKELTILE